MSRLGVLLLVLLPCRWAFAEGMPLPETSEDLNRLTSNPSLADSVVVAKGVGVSFDAGTEEGQARFRLAGGTGRRTWSLTVASPIDDSAARPLICPPVSNAAANCRSGLPSRSRAGS